MCDATGPSQTYIDMSTNYEQTIKQLEAENQELEEDNADICTAYNAVREENERYRELIKQIHDTLEYGDVYQWGDGKSVCLWRQDGSCLTKIARFQCDESARIFAEEFRFPLNDDLKKRFADIDKD